MYSGEPIDLEDLWDNTKYDIDHIYPQSKTMDDSLKNRVLVKKNTMRKIRYLSDRSRHSKENDAILEIPFDRRIYSKRKI